MIKQAVPFYLGIDGGGSKTNCVVGDDSRILGRGQGAGCNVVRSGELLAGQALRHAVTAAFASANITPSQVQRTAAGVAGAGRAEVREFVVRTLREVVSGEILVSTDVESALEAAFGEGPGVVVVSGTGSIAWARNSAGETARAGGWGWAISDEGSGTWLGREAVAALFRARDCGRTAAIEPAILGAWNLTDYQQLVVAVNATPQPDFGALLPHIVAAANAGDTLALEVFLSAGQSLAVLAGLAASRVFPAKANVPVAMSGGAFTHAPHLREAFHSSVKTLLPDATLSPDLADSVMGALRMARRG